MFVNINRSKNICKRKLSEIDWKIDIDLVLNMFYNLTWDKHEGVKNSVKKSSANARSGCCKVCQEPESQGVPCDSSSRREWLCPVHLSPRSCWRSHDGKHLRFTCERTHFCSPELTGLAHIHFFFQFFYLYICFISISNVISFPTLLSGNPLPICPSPTSIMVFPHSPIPPFPPWHSPTLGHQTFRGQRASFHFDLNNFKSPHSLSKLSHIKISIPLKDELSFKIRSLV